MTVKQMSILTDVTKCVGCNECVEACRLANNLPQDTPWRWLGKITDLSSARWTTLAVHNKAGQERFVRRHCRHCLEPACVEACIVGALKKTPEGAVIYDRNMCIGCRYCMIACPWEIPRYSWEDAVPYVQKCDLCYEQFTTKDKPPACVTACPHGATIFGDRQALIAEGKRRIKADPDKYIPKIFGENEVGGTSVLYLSDVDLKLTDMNTPVRDETPMPHRTFKVLKHMPAVFVGMAALMGGTYWIIERRQKLGSGTAEDDEKQDLEKPGSR